MQANSRSRHTHVRYRHRPAEEEEESQTKQEAEDETSDAEPQLDSATPSSSTQPPASSWFDQVNSGISSACSSALNAVKQQSALTAAVAAGLLTAAAAVGIIVAASKRGGRSQKSRGRHAANRGGDGSAGNKNKGARKTARAPSKPGPNSKLKPTRNCVALADGSAVVALRPIAADNSCLFNAVGYSMHHSMNRAPFLRQVVSREVSSDPQEYSAAFLGMENAAYCNWITNPVHWGGGIELAILAAHYRREIAAWNLATGACHVFGEEKGYTKQVMVIYNGVHYDALAISASPRADPDEDVTEFNPRTKRGKMILAAAQQLVKLHRKGKPSHSEQQQQKEQQATAAKEAAVDSSDGNGRNQPVANGPAGDAESRANNGGSNAAAAAGQVGGMLSCSSCGVRLQGMKAAEAHAAATSHDSFEEVEDTA